MKQTQVFWQKGDLTTDFNKTKEGRKHGIVLTDKKTEKE